MCLNWFAWLKCDNYFLLQWNGDRAKHLPVDSAIIVYGQVFLCWFVDKRPICPNCCALCQRVSLKELKMLQKENFELNLHATKCFKTARKLFFDDVYKSHRSCVTYKQIHLVYGQGVIRRTQQMQSKIQSRISLRATSHITSIQCDKLRRWHRFASA